MVNLSASFASWTYWMQFAFLGSNAQQYNASSVSLADIIPRRDVLYVGGEYTNVTVRFVCNYG